MGIGITIKELLSQRGMSIRELSAKTGISINTLYSITKRDNSSIRVENVQKIADFFGITADSLIGSAAEDNALKRITEDFPDAEFEETEDKVSINIIPGKGHATKSEVKEALRKGAKDKLDSLNYLGVSRAYDYINYLTDKPENTEPDKE